MVREAPSMVRSRPYAGNWRAAGTEPRAFRALNCRYSPKIAKCGKVVKLFAFGTKVFSLIPHGFHPYTLKEFWPVFLPDLVS
jgi:hypothetical protein